MLDKLAGYKTQIRVLEKKLKELDHSKLNPTKVKELTEAIQNLKNLVKEKEDKREERKRKKEEAAKSQPAEVEKEAAPDAPKIDKDPNVIVPESLKEKEMLVEKVEKDPKVAPHLVSSVDKFAVDSKVEPIRGTPGSWGTVIREAGVNGDPLVYVKWNEGPLKEAHGDYGAYYPSDLRSKVEKEATRPMDYVPREEVYNLEADLKSNYERMIADLQEEIKTAHDKGEYAWVGRLEEKLADIKKAYEEKYTKTAEDENGSGGTTKLKVVDLNPPYDKDPQEKATGYGGDRPMGAMVAPNSDENSLPLESALNKDAKEFKCQWPDCAKESTHIFQGGKDDSRSGRWCSEHFKKVEERYNKKASLGKEAINITIAEKLFIVNPLAKTAENEYVYDVSLADNSKLFKITSKDEMGQEHLSYVIEKELANHKEAAIQKHYALYVNNTLATRTITKIMAEKIAREKFPQAVAAGTYKIVPEEFPQQPSAPKMAKLRSNLAFLKKGSFVSVLGVDKVKGQIKFASLDNSLRGWAPANKFAAFGDIEQKFMDHEGHKDEVFAESGNELLVSCPAGTTNITWRIVEAPPATPESLNDPESFWPHNASLKKADEEIPQEDQPDYENDIFVDSGREGTIAWNAQKPIAKLQNDDYDTFYTEIKNWMEANSWFPTVWSVSDHGNVYPSDNFIDWMNQNQFKTSSLNKEAHIRHEDGKWVIYSHDYKKKLGTYDSKEAAEKRLKQIEYFKHQGSMQPLSKKEARKETKCVKCDKQLPVEDMVENVHGAGYLCKEHAKEWNKDASLKKADQEISLEQQVQGFRDRMNAVTERLSNPPAKTADLETTQDLSNVDVKDLSSAILHTIDLLESKVGTDVSADPELHPMLEDLENKVYEIEMKLGIKPELPEHERLEPEHQEVLKEIGEEPVEKESDMSNVPPPTPAPQGFRYAWEPVNKEWIMVADPNATGTGTGGTY